MEHDMTEDQRHSQETDKISMEKKIAAEQQAKQGSETICRCKDISKKTLPEMLMLMIKDLAFWKRPKGKNMGPR
jgi:hypothetical protein